MKYGLIGEKLTHSFSKELHTKLGNYEYEICEIKKNELSTFMQKKDFRAINVTIPYKESVIPHLHYISDEARAIGAVNTVVNRDGLLYGYNTDFFGMSALIERTGISISGKKAVILGSGGTAKTASAVLSYLGAGSILTVSREKKENTITYDELYSEHNDTEIIINTTPVGMYPNNLSSPIEISNFPKLCGVIDAIYNPLRTKLVLMAKERGIKADGGLYMLVAQGVRASEIFHDVKYNEYTTEKIYREILAEKENIVLIGMPSSGKSTVGKIIAKKLSKNFCDTDTLVEKSTNNTISEIFEYYGEKHFRELEKKEIANVSLQNQAVISTGGGVILNKENIDILKQNGKIFYIDRSPELLYPTPDRPLAQNKEALKKLYKERYDLYSDAADIRVSGDADPHEVAEEIIGGFYI